MSEVKNRRENLFVNEIPPEVLSADDVDDILDDGGYVKNTDYAGSDTAGVIKFAQNFGTTVNASGVLTGITRSDAQYAAGSNGMFLCKGTLENIIAGLVKRELIKLLGGIDNMPVGSTLTAWKAEQTADGWAVSSTMTIPPTP